MKRIICVVLSLITVFCLFGCSKSDSDLPSSTVESSSEESVSAEIKTGASAQSAAVTAAKGETTKQETTAAGNAQTTAPKTGAKTTVPAVTKPAQTTASIKKANICTISIDCETVLSHKDEMNESLLKIIPSDGMILRSTEVEITKDMSVFDVLKKVCRDNGIHFEFSNTPAYNSVYIEGIANLYERDCGALSGWMYSVNGVYPNVGCSETTVKNGDVIKWRYTCDLGWDIGGGME